MDKETRNAIERATQKARRILENELTEQLEGTYDVRLSGVVAPTGGPHLTPRQQALRDQIVASIDHRRAAGMKPAEAVTSYLRDAAFTAVNRFAALKMIEARGLAQECVSKGEQSSGYREFTGLAPGVALLPGGNGYRLYLECLFDELSTEVKVLFDRRDPASALWPRRTAFEELLGVFNAPELASVWAEDETIGWVYQYFNGDDERKQMRAESQAPRNSRELAVRNQFFTPRYVVEFLTDNTLGRIWYEMRQGKTRLVDKCDYLVRRPNEVFLKEGEKAPEDESAVDENLSQEELLKKTLYVLFRAKKDPRDLKVLDPACGSGHFLLYVFALLLLIYEEAWEDGASPASQTTGRSLRDDYVSLADLRKAIPGLILRHNLHGIDIDPRAAQIAALALWMRAQRAFNEFAVPRGERPTISRTNIVVAEPMPGEPELRREFVASLEKQLGQLVERVFEMLELAGEAGSLLRIEEEIQAAIRNVYFEQGPLYSHLDKDIWSNAEAKLLKALSAYAEKAPIGSAYRRRLFADDAARGFAFVDLYRQRYDVVLMNPPFGDPSNGIKQYVCAWYSKAATDIGAVFVLRGLALLHEGGRVGAITNRTLLAVQGFTEWRQELLNDAGLHALVDLGHGVLDAMVETAMYVCGGGTPGTGSRAAFLGLLESECKQSDLDAAFDAADRVQWCRPIDFRDVPGAPWAYWVAPSLLRRFRTQPSFLRAGGFVGPGIQTSDDFRFLRLRWEVPITAIHTNPHQLDANFLTHRWSPIVKGGEYAVWWDDIHLVLDWANDGRQLRNFTTAAGEPKSFPRNLDQQFLRGATFPHRTTSSFGLRLLPAGLSFSQGGWALLPAEGWSEEEVLAIYNSRAARFFMEVLLGQGDSSAAGTAARNYVAAAVGGIPWPRRRRENIIDTVRGLVDQAALHTMEESALFFSGARLFAPASTTFDETLNSWWNTQCDHWLCTAEAYDRIESGVTTSYELSDADSAAIAESEGPPLSSYPERTLTGHDVAWMFRSTVEELTTRAKKVCGAKRYTVKKAFFVDRSVDLGCHILRANPRSVVETARSAGAAACGERPSFASLLLSWMLGCAVNRFKPVIGGEVVGPSQLASLPQMAVEEGDIDIEIWVDDAGHRLDIISLVQKAADEYWRTTGDCILRGAAEAVSGRDDLRSWYRHQFFSYHLTVYSKSRRKAPIYWQLSIPSLAYSVWMSYQRVTKDSFYKVMNDFVGPKLAHEERKLVGLVQGTGGNPSARQRKEIAEQESFVEELRVFREEVARVAPLWSPNLNDGVIINFAPLWRLVPQQRAWQKECKDCWEKLVAGECDWAHLAMHLWPERVVPKCAFDRSLAIAHDLEEVFWVQGAGGKWKARKTPLTPVSELVAALTSPTVKVALKDLLEAPSPGGATKRSRQGTRNARVSETG